MSSIIDWFVRNRIAANLLTALIFLGGLWAAPHLKREVIPELKLQRVQIMVAYPGAGPTEVESGILQPVENVVSEVDGVNKITSMGMEGIGFIIAEVDPKRDLKPVMDQIQLRVSGLRDLPEDAERPIVSEMQIEQPAINLTLYGDADERTLKNLGNRVHDDLLALPEVTRVHLANVRKDEISIELSEDALTQYGLSFDMISQLIRRTSVDLPAGQLTTPTGNVLLRTNAKARTGDDFKRIEILRRPDGSMVSLGDVATVKDGFAESDREVRFNDKPAVTLQVFRVGDQDVVNVTDAVKRYVKTMEPQLPQGIHAALWRDFSAMFRSRIDTLVTNGLQGLVLVFLVLLLFMRPTIAIWVTNGVLFTLLGTMGVMYLMGISLNMVSLFGFILVLGTLVDDGIVVGEAIYVEVERGHRRARAAVLGASAVCWPVIVSVCTNIQTFIPVLSLPGVQAQIWAYVPSVVIIAYLVSLVESLICLPAHLSHLEPLDPEKRQKNPFYRFQAYFSDGIERFAEKVYQPALLAALRARWITLAVFVGIMLVTLGLLIGGKVKIVFFPAVVSDSIGVDITMEGGVPVSETRTAVLQIEKVLRDIAQKADANAPPGSEPTVRYVMRSIGESTDGLGLMTQTGSNVAQLFVELAPAEKRQLDTVKLVDLWREKIKGIAHVRDVRFNYSLNQAGADIELALTSPDSVALRAASDALERQLKRYPGTAEVGDSERPPRDEMQFSLRPEAEAIGLTQADLARQLRQGYYGEEVQRVQRDTEEVPVVIRYDKAARDSESSLQQVRIRAQDGAEIPLSAVADLQSERVSTVVTRINGQRSIVVSANVNRNENNPYRIMDDLRLNFLPQLMKQYPGVTWALSGSKAEESEVTSALFSAALVGILLVFAAISILFRSYTQTLLVFAVLPFAVIGAIFAHIVFGLTLSMLSMAGIVAALGVCVNDSVVLIDYVNSARKEGLSRDEAIRKAGMLRFRPIVLTTVTTFMGLSTLMAEKSAQAQVLIPMAVSLAWAVLVTTFVALLLVPVLVSLIWVDQPPEHEEGETVEPADPLEKHA